MQSEAGPDSESGAEGRGPCRVGRGLILRVGRRGGAREEWGGARARRGGEPRGPSGAPTPGTRPLERAERWGTRQGAPDGLPEPARRPLRSPARPQCAQARGSTARGWVLDRVLLLRGPVSSSVN